MPFPATVMKKQEKGVKAPPSSSQPAPPEGVSNASAAKRAVPRPESAQHGSSNHCNTGGNSSSGHQSGSLTVCSANTPSAKSSHKVPGTSHHHNPGAMGMKHSKSDHGGLGRKDKHHKEGKSPLGKKFISKSQENLSSQKKNKQLTKVADSPRHGFANPPGSTTARSTAISSGNKENLALQEQQRNDAVFVKPKPPKQINSGIRKASSTQSIDKSSQGSGSLKSSSSKSSTSLNIKRAQSTQNICKDKFTKKRTSAPADVMAYNAELLANFEKEKKLLENRISELTKMAENRKGEIEKYKYEVRRLKDQVSVMSKEEMDLLKNENKQLNDRLRELGFPAEQATDTEKLMLKLSGARGQASNSDIILPVSASCDSLSTDEVLGKGDSMPITLMSGGEQMRLDADLRRSNSLSASEPGLSLPDLCATPDHPSVLSLDATNWEKQSNKSANSDGGLSEVSVACLTERILQMEETNYSTTEELQATLQVRHQLFCHQPPSLCV